MKTEFKDFGHQMMYIYKFIERYTDLDKKCQFCGQPGQVRYSRTEPYDVQFICPDCKHSKNLNNIENRGLVPDLEVIHIKEHITDKNVLSKLPILTKTQVDIIKNLLKTKLPKGEAIRSTGWSITTFNRILNLYEKHIDKDIKNKLNDLFTRNRAAKIRISSTHTNKANHSLNNFTKIKLSRNLTNDDIVKLTNNRIHKNALSLLSTGKTTPTIQTKCLLAEAFNLYVSDVFPNDWLYSKVRTYEDYLELNEKVRTNLKLYIDDLKFKGQSNSVEIISRKTNLSVYRLYEFIASRANAHHEELVSIISLLSLK